MTDLPKVTAVLAPHGLTVLGGFHPTPADGTPSDCQTLLMVGPNGPLFWDIFTQSTEYADGLPDPLDRWSTRVIGQLAGTMHAVPLFPFGGPPWHPFIGWATRTGRIHTSPVGLLVHDVSGLFVSFRGALALTARLDLPTQPPSPCLDCADQPCRTACPADALTPRGYDVPACRTYLDTPAGAGCLQTGCAVRRACPIGQDLRPAPQSAFHMQAFRGR